MRGFRKLVRIILLFLVYLIGITGFLFLILNLPFSHRFVTDRVNKVLGNANLPIHLGTIQTILPHRIAVKEISIVAKSNDTLIQVEELRARFSPAGFLRSKVILKSVEVNQTTVELSRMSDSLGLDIAEAFSPSDKANNESGDKAKPWQISIGRAVLEGLDFRMVDLPSGLEISEQASRIAFRQLRFAPEDNSIEVSTLELKNSQGGIILDTPQNPPDEESGAPWKFGFKEVRLNSMDFTYDNRIDSLLFRLELEEGTVRSRLLDMEGKHIEMDRIRFSKTLLAVFTGGDQVDEAPGGNDKENKATIGNNFPWNIAARSILLEDSKIQLGKYPKERGIHPSADQEFSGIGLDMSNLALSGSRATMKLKAMQMGLDNGFTLSDMNGTLESDEKTTQLDLSIETGFSQVRLKGAAQGDLFGLISNPEKIKQGSLHIDQSRISLMDLACFVPELKTQPWFIGMMEEPLEFVSDLNLDLGLLRIAGTSVSQQKNFSLMMDGAARNPFDPAVTDLDLIFSIPGVDRTWLINLLTALEVDEMFPATRFALKGSVRGAFRTPEVDLSVESDLGEVVVSGRVDLDARSYDLNTAVKGLRLGDLLSNETLGRFTGNGRIEGSGMDRDSLNAILDLNIDTLEFNGYGYTKAGIRGQFNPKLYELDVQIDDPNMKGRVHATMDPGLDSMLSVSADAELKAQLNELRLTEDTLAVFAGFTASFKHSGPAMLVELEIPEWSIANPAGQAELGLVHAQFGTDTSRTSLAVNSDFFSLSSQLDIPMDSLHSLSASYRNYLMALIDTIPENRSNRVNFLPEMSVSGSLGYHDLLPLVLNDTTLRFDSLFFSLTNSASDGQVHYQLSAKELVYKQIQSGDLKVILTDSMGHIHLNVDAEDNLVNETEIHQLIIGSVFSDWKSLTNLSINDRQEKAVYQLDVATELDSNLLLVTIPSKQIILNKEPWTMTDPGIFTYNLASGRFLPAVDIKQGVSRIQVFSEEKEDIRNYGIRLGNVELSSLLSELIIQGNPSALISGSVHYQKTAEEEKKIETELFLDSIRWYDLSIIHTEAKGRLNLPRSGTYNLDLTARLDSSLVRLSGQGSDSVSQMLQAHISALPVKIFQPFAKKYVSDLMGEINGDLRISKGWEAIDIFGGVNFSDAAVRVNSLNSRFRIPGDSISFRGRRLVFNKFTVLDSLNNTLQVNGNLDYESSGQILTDLEITSSRLQVMNTGEDQDASLYGNVIIDSRLSLKGPLDNPVIKGNIQLSEGSDIYYRHSEDLSLSESEKIIQFVNFSHQETQSSAPPIVTRTGNFQRTSIEAEVDIDPSTRVSFSLSKKIYQIDMQISGGGSLNFQMLSNSDNTLSGRYVIGEGNAEVKMVGWPNKTFRITEGGYVRWFGAIEDPELKIEAVNRVRTNYTNPVDGQPRDVDFNVVLQLSNRLSDLDIVFTVNTPDQYLMSVISTLSPEEQMRQAISVLLFQKIDLPGISNSSSYVTEQVNQLVADQLNQLTKTTIQGVDVSFGIDSYIQSTEGGGQQTTTSLSYEIRKDLLDDRAQIEVSGRLNDLYRNPGASNFSVNNISFEYRLDSSATKFLKVYNEHAYEDVFEGEVVSTGIGLTFRKRFGALRDIWKRDPEKRRKKRGKK